MTPTPEHAGERRTHAPKARPIRSRAGAALAVERALKAKGFEAVVRDHEDEPVASVCIGADRWVDVFVREAQ